MFHTIARVSNVGLCGLAALVLSACQGPSLSVSLDGTEPTVASDEPAAGAHATSLVGYSIEGATARAQAAGFTGKIAVGRLDALDTRCKTETVCGVTPQHWDLQHDHTMTLWVNRNATVSARR